MTVRELTEALSLTPFHLAQPDRPVSGGYAGDLLSWVLGRAGQDAAWLTIMSNQNVAAVALMAEVSCVILTEGVAPDGDLLRRAHVLVVCGHTVTEAMKNDIAVAQRLGITSTTLEGILTVKGQGRR